MTFDERKPLIGAVEALRSGRTLVSLLNLDRQADSSLPGLNVNMAADIKEPLFRVLKESPKGSGIDLFLYSRGGDLNAVWPIVSLLREFDPNFNVIVPFRCHSSGTLLALGAQKIVMGPLSELSPIDPTTGNQFNPVDPGNPANRLGISVEDVRTYKQFIQEQLLGIADDDSTRLSPEQLQPFVQALISEVHPLALGNVQRVILQIGQLARNLLKLHPIDEQALTRIVTALTSKFYSHLHMINRHEAKQILDKRIQFAPARLVKAQDILLRAYEDTFGLRKKFFLSKYLAGKPEAEARFVGGVIESRHWSYLYETKARIRQRTKLPPNVQVQVPTGQGMPIIPGLPRDFEIEIEAQGWVHNKEPLGLTI